MTINAILASADLRDPVYMLEFQQGDIFFRYTTNADTDDTYQLHTFFRRPVSVTKLAGSVSESVSEATVTLPSTDDVVKIFDAFLPVEPVTCTIYYYERNDPDHEVRLVKSGQVTTVVDGDDAKSTLSIRPLYEAFNRSVPWQQQQTACPLMLFGVQCGVNPDLYKKTANGLTQLDAQFLISPSFTDADPTYFKAGYVKNRRTREIRFIINQGTEGQIWISYPFDFALQTDIYDAYAGCMKTGDICQFKFNNKVNFMGFEFIPVRNMFRSGIT